MIEIDKSASDASHRVEPLVMRLLHELPHNHPDRNRSLVGCWYRWKDGKTWKEIMPSFKIVKRECSYNDLGPCWTDNDVFTFDRDA